MIVRVSRRGHEDTFYEDIVAVVCQRGLVRLCRDGQADQYVDGVDDDVSVCVTP